MMKKFEDEYLRKNNRYDLERAILSNMKKDDLKTLISDKLLEEKYYKDNLVKYMKKLAQSSLYSSANELQKIFFEWLIYIKAWWMELEKTRNSIKDFKYLYSLKFTAQQVSKNKNYITKDDIDNIKNLDMEYIIIKYTNSKVNRKKALRCPLHNDNRASFQIYPQTHSFYCYGCNVWWTPIEFVAKLFNLTNKEAITKLKTDFLYI